MALDIAFLLRNRDNYFTGEDVDEPDITDDDTVQENTVGKNSGLYNSASLVNDMLAGAGYDTDIAQLADGNAIDAYIYNNRPRIVVIEALWATPDKMRELQPRWANTKFIMRGHSAFPFLALDGIGLDWNLQYAGIKNVTVASNDSDTVHDLNDLLGGPKALYLPNYYPVDRHVGMRHVNPNGQIIDIGCMGAIRPLKNHLNQAMAAIKFADGKGLHLRFHINSTRIEQGAEPVLKNLRSMFAATDHELIEHPWMDREDFLALIDSDLDIGMNVSFSETFSINAADFITGGKPMVVSSQVNWMDGRFFADPTDTDDIAVKLNLAHGYHCKIYTLHNNLSNLDHYSRQSRKQWFRLVNGQLV